MQKPKMKNQFDRIQRLRKAAIEKLNGHRFVKERLASFTASQRRKRLKQKQTLPFITDAYLKRNERILTKILKPFNLPVEFDITPRTSLIYKPGVEQKTIFQSAFWHLYPGLGNDDVSDLVSSLARALYNHPEPIDSLPLRLTSLLDVKGLGRYSSSGFDYRALSLKHREKERDPKLEKIKVALGHFSKRTSIKLRVVERSSQLIVEMSFPPKRCEQKMFNLLGNEIPGEIIYHHFDDTLYYLRNVLVPEWMITNPENITASHIQNEGNLELRRVLLDIYGAENYFASGKLELVKKIDEDDLSLPIGLRGAELYHDNYSTRRPLFESVADRGVQILPFQGTVLLRVINSTAEPDGTFKRYIFSIDPSAYEGKAGEDIVAAMASTWRKRSDPNELFFRTPNDYLAIARES